MSRTERLIFPLVAVISVLLLPSYANAAKVNVKFNQDTAFSSFETYAWSANAKRVQSVQDEAQRSKNLVTVRRAVEKELARKGFTQASGEVQPDFYVSIDGSMHEVFDVEGYHQQIGSGVALVMEGDVHSYSVGTLMIRISDRASGETVWSAWTSEKVKNPKAPESQLRKGVRKLLKRFPPAP